MIRKFRWFLKFRVFENCFGDWFLLSRYVVRTHKFAVLVRVAELTGSTCPATRFSDFLSCSAESNNFFHLFFFCVQQGASLRNSMARKIFLVTILSYLKIESKCKFGVRRSNTGAEMNGNFGDFWNCAIFGIALETDIPYQNTS